MSNKLPTAVQVLLMADSGYDHRDGRGFGVEVSGGRLRVARNLVKAGKGWIEGEGPPGLPFMYFNNSETAALFHEDDDEFDPDESWRRMNQPWGVP